MPIWDIIPNIVLFWCVIISDVSFDINYMSLDNLLCQWIIFLLSIYILPPHTYAFTVIEISMVVGKQLFYITWKLKAILLKYMYATDPQNFTCVRVVYRFVLHIAIIARISNYLRL